MKRTLYAYVKRDAAGKKKPNFGQVWGELKRSNANTKCVQTGDGLMVLDIDTKNLKEIDKKLIKLLPGTPTVETANGYHWYFEGDVEQVHQTQALFEGVDIRNEGGLVFAKYWGDDPAISYVKVGERYKLDKKLKKYLIKASKTRSKVKNDSALEVVVSGEPWEKLPDGEQHDGLRRRVEAGFKNGMGYAAVLAKYNEYIDTYLVHDAHEHTLRDGLLEHGKKFFGSNLEGVNLDPADLVTPDSVKDEARIVWDGEKGVFVELFENGLRYHKQTNFKQTLRSQYGWDGKDVNEFLGTVPLKYTKYYPDQREVDDDEVNVYKGVTFVPGEYDLILKVLDNLFIGQDAARDAFVNWLAFIVQTGRRSGIAWGFFGASGSGKGLMADVMMRMVGRLNTSFNVSDSALQSAFNPYVNNKLFIHLNEIASDFHGRHGVAGKLKALVSDPYISVNMKNMPEFDVENFANIILNSNKVAPIELDPDDRRWNMIVSKQGLRECGWWYDGAYEDAVAQSLAFGDYLMSVEVDEAAAMKPLEMSEAKRGVIEKTSSQVEIMCQYVDNLECDGLLDFLQIEPEDVLVNEIKNACDDGAFTSKLCVTMYKVLMGDKDVSARKAMLNMKPYIRSLNYGVFKLNGLSVRGFRR